MAPFLITVLGAGGKTGQECVKAALARGDSVRAVVRDPSKYESVFAALSSFASSSSSTSSPSSSKLEVVAGDVEASPEDLKKLLAGASAAIFAASASKTGDVWKVDRDGLASLAAAAKEIPNFRVVAVSSALVSPHNGWHPVRLLLNNMRGGGQKIMDAKFEGENLLRKSGVDFTVVRPGGLMDAPAPSGASSLVVTQGDRSGAGRISRSDVAELSVAAAHAGGEASRVTLEVCSDPKRERKEMSYESLFVGLEKDPAA